MTQIDPDFVKHHSSMLGIDALLIEKDLILHQVLTCLSNDHFVSKNLLFKGGTCLTKHYLGYFRFSEDLDFTWKDQKALRNKTQKQARKELSALIGEIGAVILKISADLKLDFQYMKNDLRYVELGGSNKMCTFKVWYNSAFSDKAVFIKIQVNFVEEICNDSVRADLKSLASGSDKLSDVAIRHPEYLKPVRLDLYDIRDILSEKIRAILTRRTVKERDFFDLYFIKTKLNLEPSDVERCAIKKTEHAIGMYKKYNENFHRNKMLLERSLYEVRTTDYPLLVEIDRQEFAGFVSGLIAYLGDLVRRIN